MCHACIIYSTITSGIKDSHTYFDVYSITIVMVFTFEPSLREECRALAEAISATPPL